MQETITQSQVNIIRACTESFTEYKFSSKNKKDLLELQDLGMIRFEYESYPKKHYLYSLTVAGKLLQRALKGESLTVASSQYGNDIVIYQAPGNGENAGQVLTVDADGYAIYQNPANHFCGSLCPARDLLQPD